MQQDTQFKRKGSVWQFVKRLMTYSFTRQPANFFIMLYAVGMVGAVESYYPAVYRKFIDTCLPQLPKNISVLADYLKIECVRENAFLLLGMIFLMIFHVFLFIYFAGRIGENTIFWLRRDLFYKMQEISFDFIDKNSSGWLLTRITSDTDRIIEVISWGLIGFGWGVVMICFCFGVMFYLNPYLAALVLSTIPLLIFGTYYIRQKVMEYSRESRRLNSEMIGLVNEHIYGIEVNKLLAAEARSTQIYRTKAAENLQKSFRSSFFSASYFPVVVALGSIATFMVLNIGGNKVLDTSASLSIGALASFFVYSTLVYEPIIDIANYYSVAQNSMSAGERIFSLLEEPISVRDHLPNLPDFEPIKGHIHLQDVQFGYSPEKLIIPKLNLQIESGQSIALVGPTGEGKTTIASLIARLYQPTAGQILIDGQDYRTRTIRSYRQQIGIVLQHPNIFSGTLFSNIQFGNTAISEEQVRQILLDMQLHPWAENIHMPISADGNNLSVGEKQLIALARVFAYAPKILILDEATSNLDLQTETKIQHAISKLLVGRTSIIIAHRLSTIEQCDRILVIDRGQIIEDGSHAQLLAQKGRYYHLRNEPPQENVGKNI